jgi:hypothetical protein
LRVLLSVGVLKAPSWPLIFYGERGTPAAHSITSRGFP